MYTTNGQPYFGDPNANGAGYVNAGYPYNPQYTAPLATNNPYVGGPIPVNTVTPTPTIMTKKEIDELNAINNVATNYTKEDVLVMMCDHKDNDHMIAIQNKETGEFYCPRCKQTFRLVPNENLDIKGTIKVLRQVLENLKAMGGTNVNAIREIALAITILEKMLLPTFKASEDNWNSIFRACQYAPGLPMMNYGYGNAPYGNNPAPTDVLMNYRSGATPVPQVMTDAFGRPVITPVPYNGNGYGNPMMAPQSQQTYQPQQFDQFGRPISMMANPMPMGQPQPMVNPANVPGINPFNNGGLTQVPVQNVPQPTMGSIGNNNMNYTLQMPQQNNPAPVPAPTVADITNNPVIPQAPAVPVAPTDGLPQMAPPINNSDVK